MLENQPPGESPRNDRSASNNQVTAIAARIDQRTIFAQLIEDEVRNGRLTRARRRRIIRYAAQLRLSATETGRMIDDCRRRIAQEQGINEYDRPKPRLVLAPPYPVVSVVWELWLVVVAAVLFDLLLLYWLGW